LVLGLLSGGIVGNGGGMHRPDTLGKEALNRHHPGR
jgi:hypothetical protein